MLIENGVDVNSISPNKATTALMYASNSGNLETIKLLVDNGANVYAMDRRGWTALEYARQRQQPDSDIVKYLEGKTSAIATPASAATPVTDPALRAAYNALSLKSLAAQNVYSAAAAAAKAANDNQPGTLTTNKGGYYRRKTYKKKHRTRR